MQILSSRIIYFSISISLLLCTSCGKAPILEGDPESIAKAYASLRKGDSILNSGELYDALLAYDEGIDLALKTGKDSLAAVMMLKQGKTYLKIGDIKTWESYEQRLKEEFTISDFPRVELDYLRTSFQIDKGLKLARIQNDSVYLASFLIYKGRYAGARGEKDSALFYFADAKNYIRDKDHLNNFHYYAYLSGLKINSRDLAGVDDLLVEMRPLLDSLSDLEVYKHYYSLYADYAQLSKDAASYHTYSWKRDSLQYEQTNNLAVLTMTEYQRRLDRMESQETIGFLKKGLVFSLAAFVFFAFLGSLFIILFLRIRSQNKLLIQSDSYKLKILRILSHDLRGPLVDLIQKFEKSNKSEESERVAKILSTSDELMEWTYHELKSVKIILTDVDPVEIIEEVISNVARLLPRGAEQISFDPPEEDFTIKGNPEILKFVIRNLVSNALKFSSDSSVSIRLLNEKGIISIVVQNKGPGFENTKDHPARGKGLGLDLSRNLLGKTGATLRISEQKSTTSVAIIF